jgi:uncharacterized protein (DUF58 family)
MSTQRLFDQKTLTRLTRLSLVANRVRAGALKGERRSVRRGTSIEFADYRNYVGGDDLRRVDWNLYARLDRPFVKLFEEEEELNVYIILDASASMDFPRDEAGDPAHHKFQFAGRVAAGLGYVALNGGDSLSVTALQGPGRNLTWGSYRGRGRNTQLLEFVGGLSMGGAIDFNSALREFASRPLRPGMLVLISDLLAAEGYQDGLSALLGAGHEITLIHTLSPDEVNPPLVGDLQLIDVETGRPQSVSIDANLRNLYQNRLVAWRDEIAAFCSKRDIHYVSIETSTSWDALILFDLRRLGVVR